MQYAGTKIDAVEGENRRLKNRILEITLGLDALADSLAGDDSISVEESGVVSALNQIIEDFGEPGSSRKGARASKSSEAKPMDKLPTAEQLLQRLAYEGRISGFESASWDEIQEMFTSANQQKA